MRIFFAVPRSAWVDLNLRRSLEDMGHQLVRFDFPGWPDDADPGWRQRGKPLTNQRLLDAFRSARRRGPVDLFFGYFYASVVYPATIDLIRQSGVPIVNFSCNNVHQFELVEPIAAHFDVCIVPERAALERFRAVGARPARIQLAANPRVYRPYPEPRIYDVTFVGQRYADRAEFLDHLYRHGIQVRAWGAGWRARKRLDLASVKAAVALFEDERFDGLQRLIRKTNHSKREPFLNRTTCDDSQTEPFANRTIMNRTIVNHSRAESFENRTIDTSVYGGPRLLHQDLIRTFSRSRISLGFASAGTSHQAACRVTHLRLRDFEAPMSGAFYLTERQDELDEYFDLGRELLAYTDRDDLLDQVRYYLAHPEHAERIRRAGRHRALRDHTWQQRFQELFTLLNLA